MTKLIVGSAIHYKGQVYAMFGPCPHDYIERSMQAIVRSKREDFDSRASDDGKGFIALNSDQFSYEGRRSALAIALASGQVTQNEKEPLYTLNSFNLFHFWNTEQGRALYKDLKVIKNLYGFHRFSFADLPTDKLPEMVEVPSEHYI